DAHRRLANTLNISLPALDSETMLMALDLEGVCASSGSASMVGIVVASHVLLAMGLPPALARSAIRFFIGKYTTEEEISTTAGIDRTLRDELAHLLAHFRFGKRRIEPHGREWRNACCDLGISGERAGHTLPLVGRSLPHRFIYHCQNCQGHFPRVRRIRRATD